MERAIVMHLRIPSDNSPTVLQLAIVTTLCVLALSACSIDRSPRFVDLSRHAWELSPGTEFEYPILKPLAIATNTAPAFRLLESRTDLRSLAIYQMAIAGRGFDPAERRRNSQMAGDWESRVGLLIVYASDFEIGLVTNMTINVSEDNLLNISWISEVYCLKFIRKGESGEEAVRSALSRVSNEVRSHGREFVEAFESRDSSNIYRLLCFEGENRVSRIMINPNREDRIRQLCNKDLADIWRAFEVVKD